jgi:hypothetical protein
MFSYLVQRERRTAYKTIMVHAGTHRFFLRTCLMLKLTRYSLSISTTRLYSVSSAGFSFCSHGNLPTSFGAAELDCTAATLCSLLRCRLFSRSSPPADSQVILLLMLTARSSFTSIHRSAAHAWASADVPTASPTVAADASLPFPAVNFSVAVNHSGRDPSIILERRKRLK